MAPVVASSGARCRVQRAKAAVCENKNGPVKGTLTRRVAAAPALVRARRSFLAVGVVGSRGTTGGRRGAIRTHASSDRNRDWKGTGTSDEGPVPDDADGEDELDGLSEEELKDLTPEEIQAKREELEAARLQAELLERAKAMAEQQKRAKQLYQLGQRAYEAGAYANSVTALEEAVEELGPNTQDGGEAQLWLALAYEAVGKDDEALDIYIKVEQHPMPVIRAKAKDLKYIFEAPKLKIAENERVKIPDLSEVVDTYGSDRPVVRQRTYKKVELTLEERALQNWETPIKFPNKYYAVASLILLLGVSWYSAILVNVD